MKRWPESIAGGDVIKIPRPLHRRIGRGKGVRGLEDSRAQDSNLNGRHRVAVRPAVWNRAPLANRPACFVVDSSDWLHGAFVGYLPLAESYHRQQTSIATFSTTKPTCSMGNYPHVAGNDTVSTRGRSVIIGNKQASGQWAHQRHDHAAWSRLPAYCQFRSTPAHQ